MSIYLQPTLEGELLKLRPLRPDDFDDLYAVASDPLIWEQHPANDRHEENVFKGSKVDGSGRESVGYEITAARFRLTTGSGASALPAAES